MALSDELTQRLDTLFEMMQSNFAEDEGLPYVNLNTSDADSFMYEHTDLIVPDEPLDAETQQEYMEEASRRFYDLLREWQDWEGYLYRFTDELECTFNDIVRNGDATIKRIEATERYEELVRVDFVGVKLPELVEERIEKLAEAEEVMGADYHEFFKKNCAQVTVDIMHEFESVYLPEIMTAYSMGMVGMA